VAVDGYAAGVVEPVLKKFAAWVSRGGGVVEAVAGAPAVFQAAGAGAAAAGWPAGAAADATAGVPAGVEVFDTTYGTPIEAPSILANMRGRPTTAKPPDSLCNGIRPVAAAHFAADPAAARSATSRIFPSPPRR
jgi:hypothetical protein